MELAREKAAFEADLAMWKAQQQAALDEQTANQQMTREIAVAQEVHKQKPNPDRDLAVMMAEAVERGLSNVKIQVAMPRMKRKGGRDQNGSIVGPVDEPIDEAAPAGATLQ